MSEAARRQGAGAFKKRGRAGIFPAERGGALKNVFAKTAIISGPQDGGITRHRARGPNQTHRPLARVGTPAFSVS